MTVRVHLTGVTASFVLFSFCSSRRRLRPLPLCTEPHQVPSMIFPFTFSFRLPGIINPFTAASSADPLAPPPNFKAKQVDRTHQSPVGQQPPSQALSRSVPPPTEPSPAYPAHPAYPSSYPARIASSAGTRRISRADLPKINHRRPSPSPSPSPAVLSRKRGWEPDPSPSWSTTSLTLASTSGYLDTPAKYREMAASAGNQEFTVDPDNQHVDDDMPPLKKRRGLAGSIVSTAVSAALIGTAVGLTVYRLWRDRGKEPQIQAVEHSVPESPDPSTQPPPPPYQESEWKPLQQPAPVQVSSHVTASPKTIARRKRHAASATKRPVIVYHSSRRSRPIGTASSTPVQPEFDFGQEEIEEVGNQSVVEDKMDWIGDKLSMLIEQGKRALNTEVVVMSDAKEDEIDDGSGAWEEDDDNPFGSRQYGRSTGSGPSSRAGSIRRARKPRNIVPPPPSGTGLGLYGVNASSSTSLSTSPGLGGYQATYGPSPPSTSTTYASASAGFTPSSSMPHNTLLFDSPRTGTHVRGLSYESALPSSSSVTREDTAEWESPEIRESMERARARLLARRAGGGGV
ncbi:hypothetical protein BDN70DRAFT_884476 [Pholiota conissans]|uniref:Uncharacterized protein n=1 Tax=Pholiota conissans TaxID=109636 RepID=A0A9P6CWM6_9AGAR|nr:hypothetical protein BDN70DRAFT_884476 [Pholiota conissans]